MLLSVATLTDKPYQGAVITEDAANDSIAFTEMVMRGRGGLELGPSVYGNINVNSPLRYDTRMLDALMIYAAAGQICTITPFLLMGAMAPASVPAALVQQTAESLAGIALTQLIRPGAPILMGSFLSHTDMQSGSPGFGGPESAMELLFSGQIARRFELPWRAGGGFLTSSQTPDAQAAYEGLNTMLPTFLAGANYVPHSAGWLESGLVSSFEKFIIDIEMLRMLQVEFTPLEIDEASLAWDAHLEVSAGGHFLGAAHTLERFRTCFYRPLLSSTENFERWQKRGGLDAADRAAVIWREISRPTRLRRSTRSRGRVAGVRDGRRRAGRSSRAHDPAVVLHRLSLAEVMAIATERRPVELAPAARERIAVGRQATERLLAEGKQVYGLTTGVGAMKRVTVAADEQQDFNRLLLLSHRTGTGADVPEAVVRATLLAQLAGFARGRSGVRESLADLIVAALNAGLAPRAARSVRSASRTWGRWPISPRRSRVRGSGPPSSIGSGSTGGIPTPRRRSRLSTQTRSRWARPRLPWPPSIGFW